MTIAAIITSLVFSIAFPLVIGKNAFTSNNNIVDIYTKDEIISEYFGFEPFYIFIFIGAVIFTTMLISLTKNKKVALLSYAVNVTAFSFAFNVFIRIVEYKEKFFDIHTVSDTSAYIKISGASIFMLILFIAVLIVNSIALINVVSKKEIK